jgi:hypothetical protein
MHTFIVRLFDAEDVQAFSGWIEEPLTGRRSAFHDPESLIASLRLAEAVEAAPDSDDVGRIDRQPPRGRS